ncbi:hypothetical protein HOY82DRAFT_346240 [Tuber indicum]|nr:hypothetical protein HOY82DRAFT_346240 [Tuber indicum]
MMMMMILVPVTFPPPFPPRQKKKKGKTTEELFLQSHHPPAAASPNPPCDFRYFSRRFFVVSSRAGWTLQGGQLGSLSALSILLLLILPSPRYVSKCLFIYLFISLFFFFLPFDGWMDGWVVVDGWLTYRVFAGCHGYLLVGCDMFFLVGHYCGQFVPGSYGNPHVAVTVPLLQ